MFGNVSTLLAIGHTSGSKLAYGAVPHMFGITKILPDPYTTPNDQQSSVYSEIFALLAHSLHPGSRSRINDSCFIRMKIIHGRATTLSLEYGLLGSLVPCNPVGEGSCQG